MRYFCGIDIGASAAKLVIVDENRQTVGKALRKSGVDYADTAAQCLDEALSAAGLTRDQVAASYSTGYGRDNVPWVDGRRTEIACHGKGAHFHFPRKITVIDIGAQDSKVIHLDASGRRTNFKMNRKCAAGTGAFLEEIAYRLDLPLEKLNELAEGSRQESALGSFCTVFAATEVLAKIRAGVRVEDIVKGAFRSVVKRIVEMDTVQGAMVLTGGVVAHNPFLATLLAESFGVEAMVPPDPQYVGAFGAAVFALENPLHLTEPPRRRQTMLIKDPPVQVTDSLWMLGSNEYPLYLVRGEEEAAIFEGGVGAMGPLVLEQMKTLGIERESVKQLVIPHAHPDHVMAVPLLREALGQVTVLASEPAAGVLANEKAVSFFLGIDGALTESLLKTGVIGGQHRPKPFEEKKIAVDRLLREGDTISVDGFSFGVLQTPGHSDDSLSFHEPSRGILLVSDAVGYYMPDYDAWWPDYFTGYAAYLESIERLSALRAEILCLGHRGVVKGVEAVKAHLDRSIEAAKQYHRRIVQEVKSGKPVRQVAEQLGAEVHEKTPLLPLEFFQKNCNLLVKQSLKQEGIGLEK